MAKHFTKNLVDLSNVRLRTDARAEFGLDHGEGRLDVRPLVIVRQELLAAIHEKIKGFGPQVARARRPNLQRKTESFARELVA